MIPVDIFQQKFLISSLIKSTFSAVCDCTLKSVLQNLQFYKTKQKNKHIIVFFLKCPS